MFTKNQVLTVSDSAPFHKNRKGKFAFMGGPKADCVVLQDLTEPNSYFAVSPEFIKE